MIITAVTLFMAMYKKEILEVQSNNQDGLCQLKQVGLSAANNTSQPTNQPHKHKPQSPRLHRQIEQPASIPPDPQSVMCALVSSGNSEVLLQRLVYKEDTVCFRSVHTHTHTAETCQAPLLSGLPFSVGKNVSMPSSVLPCQSLP